MVVSVIRAHLRKPRVDRWFLFKRSREVPLLPKRATSENEKRKLSVPNREIRGRIGFVSFVCFVVHIDWA